MYNKLFTKILDSTIWLESDATRLVWITFIAAMDEDGFVALSSIGNVAARARVSTEAAEAAIRTLESPDAADPSQEHDGRRIERVPSGWMVLNSAKYRDIIKRAEAREHTRERVARFRARNADVTPSNDGKQKVTLSDTDTDTDTDTVEAGASLALVPPGPLETILPSNIPYKEIVALYNNLMEKLPRVRHLNNARRELVRKAWQSSKECQVLTFWKQYFEECSNDDFLNGTGPYRGEFVNWSPTFDYLMRTKVIVRTHEKALHILENSR